MLPLAPLTEAGLTVAPHQDRLIVSPRSKITAEARAYIAEHREELLDLLTRPRRLWLVRHADGTLASHSLCPEATWEQMRTWYPNALSIVPEEEPFEDQEAILEAQEERAAIQEFEGGGA